MNLKKNRCVYNSPIIGEKIMQEFLANNTVNCNLMSLTGYRTLVILNALIESPKTNDEINNYLLNNQYIKEKFSNDTLRLYINSLREIGCDIIAANKSNDKKYELISHPFAYDITKPQLKALSKLYKSTYDKIDIIEVVAIENFFKKIITFLKNDSTIETIKDMSLIRHVNRDILNELLIRCKNKNQITFLYNSPKSNGKEIEIIADKLAFKSDKLYLWGTNLTHREYSYFAVDRILKIYSIKLLKDSDDFTSSIKVIYEYTNYGNDYIPKADEKIIKKTDDKLTIEVISKNEFSLMQRILEMGNNCKVLEPQEFKIKLIDKLKTMRENYETV